jgi:protein-S-isoprenylcysteine O-methyltransferase Ste14
MYTAVLSISCGLALLIQSWVVLVVFVVYLSLISSLIPIEEEGLRNAYGEEYAGYRQKVRMLIPFVY